MTKIIIAPDSFKECLSAREVARAIASGVRRAIPKAEIIEIPLADGGEGTVDAMVSATGGTYHTVTVCGPMRGAVDARFGILGDHVTAVIEMAAACGLGLVPQEKRNPLHATTRGLGELIRHALDLGVRKFIIGIGGSATVDGGAGMAQALGARLADSDGNELAPGGGALINITSIDCSGMDLRLRDCSMRVACDVTNPLCGPNGAAAVYGPQKGATPEMVTLLDAALARFAEVVKRSCGVSVAEMPGAGAAGGLGAGLVAFLNAELVPGVELVMQSVGFREAIADASAVFTGEGRVDGQSAQGKTTCGVVRACRDAHVPCYLLAGAIGSGYKSLWEVGPVEVFSIAPQPATLDEAFKNCECWLANAAERVARSFLVS